MRRRPHCVLRPRCAAPAVAVLLPLLLPTATWARRADAPALETISRHLTRAMAPAPGREAERRADPLLQWRDGRVRIDVRFRALTQASVEAMRALGAEIEHVSLRYGRVLAAVDPAVLPAVAAVPGVSVVHPDYGAQRSTGAVSSQAERLLRADAGRARFGIDGSGVRVGVLSDSFSQRLGGMISGAGCDRILVDSSPQFSRDLPDTIVVLDDGPRFSSDEGAALAEIVHDIAPGAGLLFGTAYPSEAAFAESIERLVACGADVLVDDVLFFAEPMFQDGIVAQAAQAAVDAGAPFFSAAGNQGVAGVDDVYRDAVPDVDDKEDSPTSNDLHDFGDGPFAAIDIPTGCGVRFVLQWDEPFSGALGGGASTDLDLYVFNEMTTADILARGDDPQGCGTTAGAPSGDPLEIVLYTNTSGVTQRVYAGVEHFCGREDVRFRIVTFEPNFASCRNADAYAFAPEIFDAVQIYGHPAAAGVAAVAAVFFGEIESGGTVIDPPDVIDVEPFSARGGEVPIVFGPDGAPLAGGTARRFKPELAAPDGVNSFFFGVDSDYDADAFRNFVGTSAATPHVAAAAALMLAMSAQLGPADIVDILRRTAVDVDAPGRDPLAGDGVIDVEAALEAVASHIPATPTPTPTATSTGTATPSTTPALPGDCDADGRVMIAELIVAVRIAIGEAVVGVCEAVDGDGNGLVGINELIRAVAAAL